MPYRKIDRNKTIGLSPSRAVSPYYDHVESDLPLVDFLHINCRAERDAHGTSCH